MCALLNSPQFASVTGAVTVRTDNQDMQIQIDRAYIPANASCIRYLHVTVNAPAMAAKTERPRVSVAFVLDRSGSMDGEKIVLARQAVGQAIRLLQPTDHFSIVSYDEEISTVLELTPASKEAKALAQKKLASINARGATDLHGGWMRGAELVRPPEASGDVVSKVLLLTDGLANRGIVDRAELIEAATRLRATGIMTSTFGVGADFDEDLLSRLATNGGGHFYFIETPKQIPDFLASELGETLEVVLRDVCFEISFDHSIKAGVINELPCERQPGRMLVRLGNMVSDQEISFVVAMVCDEPVAEGATIAVECRMSDAGGVLPPHPMTINWQAVDAANDASQPVNADVIFATATFLAEKARRTALAANAAGDFEAAKAEVEAALHALHLFAKDDQRVRQLIKELQNELAEVQEPMAPMLRKSRHFASYLTSSSRAAGGTARRNRS